jgi:predicted dehydrogenase
MKQVIQNYRNGHLELADVPVPVCGSNKVLVRNANSLVSVGTERSMIDLGRKSLLGKARARPDLVKRFVEKAKKEGLLKTYKEALGRLDNPTALGYSSAGVVVEVGSQVHGLSPGDRVACIGAGFASHAEYVSLPEMLCAKLPAREGGEGEARVIPFDEASFGMLGIIALHGIRSAKVEFGSAVTVVGLGLLGQLTVQMLKAYGCRVIATDLDVAKNELAKRFGADRVVAPGDDLLEAVEKETAGYGCDAVIITTATDSHEPVDRAVDISRHGGKVVVVGVAGIQPSRNEMWHKEVEIVVSKGGGPGMLDPTYELGGVDYPLGHVRWTQKRNLEEFLRLVAVGDVDLKALISHRFPFAEATDVYAQVLSGEGGPYIGVLFDYPAPQPGDSLSATDRLRTLRTPRPGSHAGKLRIGVLGAGLFGKGLLLPALRKVPNVELHTLATSASASTYHTGKTNGFLNCSTDYRQVLRNPEIDATVILTPHSAHAHMVGEAIEAGKDVFVEKPLCVTEAELSGLVALRLAHPGPRLAVGYNRRFSPHSIKMREWLGDRKDPLVAHYRVNAGYIAPDHWVHSDAEGGSRIVGEICHFVDLLQFLTGAAPVRVFAERTSGNNKTVVNSDNAVITIKFSDGSVASILYSGSGDKAFAREHVEIFCEGKTIVSEDFRRSALHSDGKTTRFKTASQEIGYAEELKAFCGAAPMFTDEELFLSTLAVFKIGESLTRGASVNISLDELLSPEASAGATGTATAAPNGDAPGISATEN